MHHSKKQLALQPFFHMEKIIFLHGFFASGSCPLAQTLRQELKDTVLVLSPDLPLHPDQALDKIRQLCLAECPRLLVGNSCGSFYAQLISQSTGLPALLGNPHFAMTRFLSDRIGDHEYKSPRKDGRQQFSITPQLVTEFARLEAKQFDAIPPHQRENIWGLFGTQDTLAHFEPLFLQYYSHSFHFPGAHTPTTEEVRQWYIPLIKKMLERP